jgi:hypothetical protein
MYFKGLKKFPMSLVPVHIHDRVTAMDPQASLLPISHCSFHTKASNSLSNHNNKLPEATRKSVCTHSLIAFGCLQSFIFHNTRTRRYYKTNENKFYQTVVEWLTLLCRIP